MVNQRQDEDFRVADVAGGVTGVLEALRTRLLDLTLLNRVLNFKVNSPRVLRVIDELPDHLFKRFLDGAELELLPVPSPPKGHLLHSVLETGKKERTTAATTYAAELGFDTSFDLPARPKRGQRIAERHGDDAIQTLLFSEDLEVVLSALQGETRSAIEEKGSNILYVVFGMLEWYERDDSPKAIVSPLLMLPVAIRRGEPDRKTGNYRFYLSYTEEDVLSNVSLQEKLRRDFKVTLPEVSRPRLPRRCDTLRRQRSCLRGT